MDDIVKKTKMASLWLEPAKASQSFEPFNPTFHANAITLQDNSNREK